MRAAVYRRYGLPEVVAAAELPTPEPGVGEVLVRVRAASVGAADGAARRGTPRVVRLFSGLFNPRLPVLGSDFAGEVTAVGDGVTTFAVGDRVVGASGPRLGCHAQYVTAPASGVITALPAGVSFEQAAALMDGALTALPFLRDGGRIRPGHRVLVNGASGSVGSAGVQLAKHFGAHVTAVTSGPNVELVRSIGADVVIDYGTRDFTEGDDRYDIVFDAVGTSSYRAARRVLTRDGMYLSTVPGALLPSLFTRRAAVLFTGLRKRDLIAPDAATLVELASAGILVPLIDSRHDLERVAGAHSRVDSGRKRGTVVLHP